MERIRPDEITKTVKMLKPLKLILGIGNDEKDGLLLFLIDDTIDTIMGYCKICRLPEELYTTVTAMAADMYRRKGYGKEAAPEKVKSVSQGKRSVSFENGVLDTNAFLREYHNRLKPFINRKGILPSEVESYV